MSEPDLRAFVSTWQAASAAERAHKDMFLNELCDVLGVARPNPGVDDEALNTYVFEKSVTYAREGGTTSVKKIDLYKAGHFLLEAKQGSNPGAKTIGTARRGTTGWDTAMQDARGQALAYTVLLDKPVPFLLVCDIGHCFDLYADFTGARRYEPFPSGQFFRVYLRDLPSRPDLVDRLRRVFEDPYSLDPSRNATKVTEAVAADLAKVAAKLEAEEHHPELIAKFLMRCVFTMFAEDVGLLPDQVFTEALAKYWIESPASFPGGIESLWRTMNDGGHTFGVAGRILKFNGGLFRDCQALPLSRDALETLLRAARQDWSEVEPAIFGTLLESALSKQERHRLGAHYTPRAYVERLVRPTLEEPLRDEWDTLRVQVRTLLVSAENAKSGQRTKKLNEAAKLVRGFHRRLLELRILDPACGTGNFLYVALDLLKRLESDVLAVLAAIEGGDQDLLHLEGARVSPEQFLGIEIKPWAKEIAELVLWIGYLQWHFRQYGQSVPVPEPVLRDYKNIECRDAVLAYDGVELVRDETGKPVSRWDGTTMKIHPVTGKEVPDESAQVAVEEYVNPRRAEWPRADFIVGNPPFIGSKRMREYLGDGYVDALRRTYDEIPDGTDYVLYWWVRAAQLVASKQTSRFGLITTNSITQSLNRKATEPALFDREDVALRWAIPDHPWVDSANGAAVRIAMTVGAAAGPACLLSIQGEVSAPNGTPQLQIVSTTVDRIHSDLRAGANVASASPLASNEGICSVALVRFGDGFVVGPQRARELEPEVVFPLLTGRDLNQIPEERYVIDFYPLSEDEAMQAAPRAFQHLLEHVKPAREQIRDPSSRRRWWRFGRDKPELRQALSRLHRYIATSEVSKNRVFSFIDGQVRPDHSLVVVASEEACHLGVLQSRVHAIWAAAAGGRLGVGNDLRYNRSKCFDPFPFPEWGSSGEQRISQIAKALDGHRKTQQALHAKLTLTGMYNVLEKLRSGEPLTAKEKTHGCPLSAKDGVISISYARGLHWWH